MTWTEVYTQCMDGEYYRGPCCPRDGSANDISTDLAALVETIRAVGETPNLETLAAHGYGGPLSAVIVLQVSSADVAPDWFWLDRDRSF
jgi:hypothetical protein